MLTSLPPDSELLKLQTNFTRHLRNPETYPVPEGLDKRRMGIYSDLIFNNIAALVSEFFPVLHKMLDKTAWDNLIREFFITWQAETPYFPQLAEEFLKFLMSRPGTNHEPEYLLPLAHYEWLELYLFISEHTLPDIPVTDDELRTQHIKLSELAIPASYAYPVHQIKPGWDEESTPAYLLVARDTTDGIRFFELQPLAYELLHNMQTTDEGIKVVDWLKEKAAQLGQDETSFVNFGLTLVQQVNTERLFYVNPNQPLA